MKTVNTTKKTPKSWSQTESRSGNLPLWDQVERRREWKIRAFISEIGTELSRPIYQGDDLWSRDEGREDQQGDDGLLHSPDAFLSLVSVDREQLQSSCLRVADEFRRTTGGIADSEAPAGDAGVDPRESAGYCSDEGV